MLSFYCMQGTRFLKVSPESEGLTKLYTHNLSSVCLVPPLLVSIEQQWELFEPVCQNWETLPVLIKPTYHQLSQKCELTFIHVSSSSTFPEA